mmetsp:Transcript_123299/g.307950  ORF Transcript_123299/g.307950 Transcript_123299/m.307950 type:complete len:202 (-) Transcript_123299:202-807(-)
MGAERLPPAWRRARRPNPQPRSRFSSSDFRTCCRNHSIPRGRHAPSTAAAPTPARPWTGPSEWLPLCLPMPSQANTYRVPHGHRCRCHHHHLPGTATVIKQPRSPVSPIQRSPPASQGAPGHRVREALCCLRPFSQGPLRVQRGRSGRGSCASEAPSPGGSACKSSQPKAPAHWSQLPPGPAFVLSRGVPPPSVPTASRGA